MKSPSTKREKRSILQILMQYLKKKPVTEEDLKQLRLEAERYRLKADIAKSNAEIRDSKGVTLGLGSSASQRPGFAESYSDTEDRISRLLRGAVGARDVDVFGNNDDKSDKEKEAYRKRVLGL